MAKADLPEDCVEFEGRIYKMPADLKALPDLDLNDPDVKRWLKEQEQKARSKYPDLTYDEIQKHPDKSFDEIIALRNR